MHVADVLMVRGGVVVRGAWCGVVVRDVMWWWCDGDTWWCMLPTHAFRWCVVVLLSLYPCEQASEQQAWLQRLRTAWACKGPQCTGTDPEEQ